MAPRWQASHLAQQALDEALRDPAVTDTRLHELNQHLADARFQELSAVHALLKTNLALLTPEPLERFRTALPLLKALEQNARPPHPDGPPRDREGSRPEHPGSMNPMPPPQLRRMASRLPFWFPALHPIPRRSP